MKMMKNITNLIQNKDHTCPWWLCFTFDNILRKLIHNPIRLLNLYTRKGDAVLDLGPGMGFFTIPLCQLVGDKGMVYAADIQSKMLERIEIRAGKKNIENLTTYLIENNNLDIDKTFDFILAFWMFHEVSDKKELVETLLNKLKVNGKLFIAEPIIHVSKKSFEDIH
jgi:ubiquinone/menaquinone biosynthesis C-methylase UbiE